MACYSPVTERKVAAATPRVGCCLPASTLFAATNPVAFEPLLPVLSSGSIFPRPQEKPLVPPLMDGWQRRCNNSNQGPASERAGPNVARRSFPGRSDMHHPSNVGAQGHLHRPFLGACMLLDDESVGVWRQQERAVKGSLSARTWMDVQREALRWETHHSNAGSVGGLLKEQLLQSDSATAFSTPTSCAASISSVASTVDDLALVGHGRLSRGHDSAKQEVSHSADRTSLLKQNNAATEHFNMAADDWLEVEEEFFPENCNAIDCS
mmetsp:Transcript_95526/g.189338  ORF Transcript_95526/g.189338 Transcript_95526/m.189338 type:complete len:266 (+) Transcript_95526:68-865(+)